jgi:carbon monoxide dehydrogenase subunit G
MARYRMSIRTDLSAPEAFAYMADMTNFADWDPGVESAEQVRGDGPGMGAEYDIVASGSELRYVVDVFDPDHRIRATGRNRWLTSVDAISVTPDGTGSVVTYDADLTLHGLLKVGDPILALAFRRIGDRAADGLVDQLRGERI